MKPPTEADRVLGQVARGEVRAGAAAAREIAARHEAAYGDVWPADHAWVEAIGALTTATKDGAQ